MNEFENWFEIMLELEYKQVKKYHLVNTMIKMQYLHAYGIQKKNPIESEF